MSDEANQKPDLGAAFVATNKQKPTSYDLSGTIVVAGTKYRFGAYAKKAKGGGKMPEGVCRSLLSSVVNMRIFIA